MLKSISPIDGRYSDKSFAFQNIGSEYALLRYRSQVEIEWLIFLTDYLSDLTKLNSTTLNKLRSIYLSFSDTDAQRIKAIEKTTNHDVKAVEYFLKEKLSEIDIDSKTLEYIHFACTSEDINNTAYALMYKDIRSQISQEWSTLVAELTRMALLYQEVAMLSRTHGQTASPTTCGKEFAVFVYRLKRKISQLKHTEILAKMNGAVGNYNAHHISYPELDWVSLSKEFVETRLKLTWNPLSTQIEPHDWNAEFNHCILETNCIFIDLCRDIWSYISIAYFKQKIKEGEIGSSTMPHKINPIDFENAEGNYGIANSLLSHLAEKLTISRWQRDLSDSTVLRNSGMIFAYCSLANQSLLKGLLKLEINQKRIQDDLNNSWEVLGEAIQTVMKRYGIPHAYEKLKELTRGQDIHQENLRKFIVQLEIPQSEIDRLLALKPENYLGKARELIQFIQ